MNLQSTLSAATGTGNEEARGVQPHHPITCESRLGLDEDGTFSCEHSLAPPDDGRTRFCLNHSLAIPLMDLAEKL